MSIKYREKIEHFFSLIDTQLFKINEDFENYELIKNSLPRLREMAKEALYKNEIERACLCFMLIGHYLGQIGDKSIQQILDNKSQKKEAQNYKDVRERPLRKKNKIIKILKKQAILLAIQMWYVEDEFNEYRIGFVAEVIWTALTDITNKHLTKTTHISSSDIQIFKDAVPKTPNQVKNWIRPIAPKYAKKRGRPKNININLVR